MKKTVKYLGALFAFTALLAQANASHMALNDGEMHVNAALSIEQSLEERTSFSSLGEFVGLAMEMSEHYKAAACYYNSIGSYGFAAQYQSTSDEVYNEAKAFEHVGVAYQKLLEKIVELEDSNADVWEHRDAEYFAFDFANYLEVAADYASKVKDRDFYYFIQPLARDARNAQNRFVSSPNSDAFQYLAYDLILIGDKLGDIEAIDTIYAGSALENRVQQIMNEM